MQDELDRYGRDYRLDIVCDGDHTMARLADIQSQGSEVAMVLADLALGASDGVEVLAKVRSTAPTARRVLLLEWGSAVTRCRPCRGPSLWALSIRFSPSRPVQRDEDFHTAVTEDLSEWAWATTPVVEAVKIVGTNDGRGREIHDLLDRLGVPSGLHDADFAEWISDCRSCRLGPVGHSRRGDGHDCSHRSHQS